MSIEERIAEIVQAHSWATNFIAPRKGQPPVMCTADGCDWELTAPYTLADVTQAHAGHVARVLTTELGMTPEWTVEYDGAVHQRPHAGSPNAEMKRRAEKLFANQTVHERRLVTRYVTPWETT